MSVNLLKNKDALLSAWKDVLDDKTSTNWALFGYEGLSNDLKFVSKGSGGIDELVEDFNSGQIMYAFLQVTDPKTSLPKNVLINWQGEGAPNVRKGTCANHVRDVNAFFKGAHVTLNARTEEEVDSTIIIDKVSKSTGSVYKFNERTEITKDSGPVGTTYKRTIPKQEINSVERDKFWEKQEAEERQRQDAERHRREDEKKKLEVERQKRDAEESAQREAKILEATKSINQIRLAEKASFDRAQVVTNQPVEDLEKEELERRNRADILRRQRSEEAQSLISKRTINARAVFEQNTAAGQLTQRRSSVQPRSVAESVSSVRRSSEATNHLAQDWRKREEELQNVEVQAQPSKIESKVVEKISVETVKTQQQVPLTEPIKTLNGNGINTLVEEEPQEEWEDDVKHNIPATVSVSQPPAAFEDPLLSDPLYNGDYGLRARALYDYQAADETEITFDPGDIISNIDQIDEGWWQGFGPDGNFGLFPANYVELMN